MFATLRRSCSATVRSASLIVGSIRSVKVAVLALATRSPPSAYVLHMCCAYNVMHYTSERHRAARWWTLRLAVLLTSQAKSGFSPAIPVLGRIHPCGACSAIARLSRRLARRNSPTTSLYAGCAARDGPRRMALQGHRGGPDGTTTPTDGTEAWQVSRRLYAPKARRCQLDRTRHSVGASSAPRHRPITARTANTRRSHTRGRSCRRIIGSVLPAAAARRR